jgi:hypothetical protein
MSSQANIGTLIMDVAEFFDALADLKRAARKAERLRTSDGALHRVEAVFDDGLGRQAGLQKTEKGYRVVADCHGLSPEEERRQAASIQQVVQRYAYRKVLRELQGQGYVVAEEEKRPDGAIRLVVRKWS